MNDSKLDAARGQALAAMDKARRVVIWLVVLTAACEAMLLIALLVHMDWGNDLHRLIVIATFLVYWTLGFAVLALGAYTRWWALRIVRAVQLGPEA